ncbi:MAG TPA: class I SAM-dependent methyltransferase [Acidimicrobiia bacterium]|jgi:SAM-dependent methyltransferase|nr:class I SAM-dependent methyltransferase [Acidimicrobiia bacterium]
MEGYETTTFGRLWAPYYDEIYSKVEGSMIDLLARHAGDPPRALELAIGSGRVALPLCEKGVAVEGIDASEEMVALMRAKPGGEAVPVVIGDFGDVDVDAQFPLIYLVFNTLFGLLTQERQVECFENVAERLEPGGRFIIDCFVPDVKRFDRHNTRLGVSTIESVNEHMYEMSVYEPVSQRVSTHVVRRDGEGETVVLPVEIRFAWPSELDLMARLAGLELEDRFGWYDLRPFTEQSTSHMSIYRKPE